MSMAVCRNCQLLIDTDEDPDSTYFDQGCVCEDCREDLTPAEEAEHKRNLQK